MIYLRDHIWSTLEDILAVTPSSAAERNAFREAIDRVIEVTDRERSQLLRAKLTRHTPQSMPSSPPEEDQDAHIRHT